MNATELRMHRRNTDAFIAVRPTVIALIPRTRQVTGTGARLLEDVPRPEQTFRLIEQSAGTVEGADGVQRRIEFQLLGSWNATIGLYDRWKDETGTIFEVVDLLPFNEYERRAQVVRYGET